MVQHRGNDALCGFFPRFCTALPPGQSLDPESAQKEAPKMNDMSLLRGIREFSADRNPVRSLGSTETHIPTRTTGGRAMSKPILHPWTLIPMNVSFSPQCEGVLSGSETRRFQTAVRAQCIQPDFGAACTICSIPRCRCPTCTTSHETSVAEGIGASLLHKQLEWYNAVAGTSLVDHI